MTHNAWYAMHGNVCIVSYAAILTCVTLETNYVDLLVMCLGFQSRLEYLFQARVQL